MSEGLKKWPTWHLSFLCILGLPLISLTNKYSIIIIWPIPMYLLQMVSTRNEPIHRCRGMAVHRGILEAWLEPRRRHILTAKIPRKNFYSVKAMRQCQCRCFSAVQWNVKKHSILDYSRYMRMPIIKESHPWLTISILCGFYLWGKCHCWGT